MTTMSPSIAPQPAPQASETRPRAHTSLSFASNRSRRSSASGHKIELTESAKDKKRLNTKSDPSRALNEATPAEQAQEHATVEDLRGVIHKDLDGNIITDPDRSNPTRHRLERPLDTIRSFNAAAEGTTSRRSSYNSRPASQVGWNGDMNRRASYYSNNGFSPQRQQRPSPGGGYYRNTSYGFGPQSAVEEEPGSHNVYARTARQPSNPYMGAPHAQNSQYGHHPHPPFSNQDSPISAHSYQHSHETMTSGSDELSKSTNPSSQNSSNDQLPQLRKYEEYSSPNHNSYANDARFNHASPNQYQGKYDNPYGSDAVQPPVPQVQQYPPNNTRQPIKLNSSPSENNNVAPPPPTKRQSWIKRKFSKREV